MKNFPFRIISLVPSITELLFDLGLEKHIVGITKFCIHPKEKASLITKIGGTKNPKIEVIDSLLPDLIIANKEENRSEDIEKLSQKYPVFITDVNTYDDAIEMIACVGQIANSEELANELNFKIEKAWSIFPLFKNETYLYFIWKNPWMVAGKDTFITNVLDKIGFQNATAESRYPEIELGSLSPSIIFLSSEPFPFKEKHIEELKYFYPKSKIIVVDGEMFSWYGSRMLSTPNYIRSIQEKLLF